MTIIGLTGLSGAGKSTIAAILKKECRALVIDVDQVGHQVLSADKSVRKKILKFFGTTDRQILGPLVFGDSAKLKKLNSIMHPVMKKRIRRILAENKPRKLIVIDAALLFQMGLDRLCEKIIKVLASQKTITARLQKKGIRLETIKARLKAQGG